MVPSGDDGVYSSIDGDYSSGEGAGNFLSRPLHAAAVTGKKAALRRLLQEAGNNAEIVNSQDHAGRTALVYSILGDRQDCAGLLLKAGANVNAADGYGMTALHYAANQGNHKCSKLLLSKGADCNARNNEGRTPLHFAAEHKSHKCLGLLLKRIRKGEVDLGDNDSLTPLHCAAASGSLEHVKQLLKAGASSRRTDFEKKTALHWAARNEHAGVMRLLLEHDMDVINWPDVEGRAAIHLAAAHQNSAKVKVLLSTGRCNISLMDNIGRSPLHWAAVLGNSRIVSQLLSNKADYKAANENGATALHYAAQGNFAETVDVMLSFSRMGDLRDNEGRTALVWAAGKGADQALETMLRHKVDLELTDRSGGTALHGAAYSGHVGCVQLLLQFGACVNTTDAVNQTALFRACEKGHAEVVKVLLENNAQITLDKDKRSPLHWAARGGHTLVCEILIKHGVRLDGKDRSRVTPLHCAAYSRSLNCLLLLIKRGAAVNRRDVSGNTALHWSCLWGHLEAVKLLVGECNAFVNFKGAGGDRLTPLNYAILGDHQDVAKYMIEKGGLTITNIEELAAACIQHQWRCYQLRKSFQTRKNLLKRHEQLKGIKKKRAGSLLHSGDLGPGPHGASQRVRSDGSGHDVTSGSGCESEFPAGGLQWEERPPAPGPHGPDDGQAAMPSKASQVNSSAESCDLNPAAPACSDDDVSCTQSPTPVEPFHPVRTGANTTLTYSNKDSSEDARSEELLSEKDGDVSVARVMSEDEEIAASSSTGEALPGTPVAGDGGNPSATFEGTNPAACEVSREKLAWVQENYQRTHKDWLKSEEFSRREENPTNSHESGVENLTVADKSKRARKERERLRYFRVTVGAAVAIQRCFRRHVKRKREVHEPAREKREVREPARAESEELTREIAALTIQLAWRRHRRGRVGNSNPGEKTARGKTGRPSVTSLPSSGRRRRASSQGAQRSPLFGLWRTRKVTPSAALVSYHVAVGLYQPGGPRPRDKRAATPHSATRTRPKSVKRSASGWTSDVKLAKATNSDKSTRGAKK